MLLRDTFLVTLQFKGSKRIYLQRQITNKTALMNNSSNKQFHENKLKNTSPDCQASSGQQRKYLTLLLKRASMSRKWLCKNIDD